MTFVQLKWKTLEICFFEERTRVNSLYSALRTCKEMQEMGERELPPHFFWLDVIDRLLRWKNLSSFILQIWDASQCDLRSYLFHLFIFYKDYL